MLEIGQCFIQLTLYLINCNFLSCSVFNGVYVILQNSSNSLGRSIRLVVRCGKCWYSSLGPIVMCGNCPKAFCIICIVSNANCTCFVDQLIERHIVPFLHVRFVVLAIQLLAVLLLPLEPYIAPPYRESHIPIEVVGVQTSTTHTPS